jgi:predicted DNA binding CopG/RHH family protein
MPSKKTTIVSLRLPNEDYHMLIAKAQKRGISPSEWLRPIIHTALHAFKPKNVE